MVNDNRRPMLVSNTKHSSNIFPHCGLITREQREALNGHRSCVLWFTGLSGAGKSTLAHSVEEVLFKRGLRAFVLDGDNIRHGLNSDLGFSDQDRRENIRRIGEMAKLMAEAGLITMAAFISPFAEERNWVRSIIPKGTFLEIYCRASIRECEARDVKGLYKKARAGGIPNFTGITSPYEPPENPEAVIDTGRNSLDDCTSAVLRLLHAHGILKEMLS